MEGWVKLLEYDENLRTKHGGILCGVDECGRGAWAGPLVAAACVLPRDVALEGLNDSKVLSARQREGLCEEIREVALSYAVAFIDAAEIDRGGIDAANTKAMQDAAREAASKLAVAVSLFVVDQSPGFFLKPCLMLPKADGTSLCVAAASVLAKTVRDQYMSTLAIDHPAYGWDVSHGYITDAHKDAVIKLGMVDGLHRKSFAVSGVNKPRQVTLADFLVGE